MSSHFSKHAKVRSQQRAIPHLEAELMLMYGECLHLGQGKRYWSINKRGLKRLKRDVRRLVQNLDELQDRYVIDGDHGVVVTVGHKLRRQKQAC